jgi:hypothetical protein
MLKILYESDVVGDDNSYLPQRVIPQMKGSSLEADLHLNLNSATKDDSRYIPPAPDTAEDKDICPEESADGWLCTRWLYHKGDHAAHDPSGKMLHRWVRGI